VIWSAGGLDILVRTPGGTSVLGFMPVVPATLLSAAVMLIVSKLTRKPSAQTVERYFPVPHATAALR
jgi:hypothetical protein